MSRDETETPEGDEEGFGGRITVRLPMWLDRRIREVARRSSPPSTPSAVLREMSLGRGMEKLQEMERLHGITP